MEYRRLGNSGLRVSALGLGTNAFGKRADEAASTRIIHAAMDQGINFIDTANIYAGTESERIIGQALTGRRENAVLATKAGLPRHDGPHGRGSSRYHLQQELEHTCGVCKRIMWICTRSILLIRIHRWMRHCAHWMIWSLPAKSVTSVPPTMQLGS